MVNKKVNDLEQHLFDFGPTAVGHSGHRLYKVLRTPGRGFVHRCNRINNTHATDTGRCKKLGCIQSFLLCNVCSTAITSEW